MALSIFPAAPGTVLLTATRGQPGTTMTPVVAYQHIQAGIVFPLCPMKHGGLTRGVALQTPDGLVTDPSFGMVFTNAEEWLKTVATEGYWTAKDKLAYLKPAEPAAEDDDDDDPVGAAKPKDKGGRKSHVATGKAPVAAKDLPQVFSTKSFWKTTDEPGNPKAKWAIFECEPGIEAPAKSNARYVKIKRDEFFELRRNNVEVIEWPLKLGGSPKKLAEDFDDGI